MIRDIFRIKKMKERITKLESENENHLKSLDKANKEINELKKLNNSCNSHNCSCYNINETEIDITKFITEKFLEKYLLVETNEGHSDEELLNRFNNLLNEERKYLIGLLDCVDFIKNKRNKKISIEKQLEKQLFTEYGRNKIDELIKEMNSNVGETFNV